MLTYDRTLLYTGISGKVLYKYHHWLNYQLIIWIFIFFHFQTIWISQMCICSIYLKISSVIYAVPIFYKWWLIFTVPCGGQYSRSTRVSKAVEGREMSKISLLKAWNKNVWQGETNWKWINNISNDTGTVPCSVLVNNHRFCLVL